MEADAMKRPILLAAVLACALRATAHAQGTPVTYAAFGDSITFGYHDSETPAGYPPRLQVLLQGHGISATVLNDGLSGETTAEGLTRVSTVLTSNVNVLLLMEGTNDISQKVSVETITTNLDLMALKAQQLNISTIHATCIPRLPSANTDGDNLVGAQLAASVRDLAWSRNRGLVDPFEEFGFQAPDAFANDYFIADDDNLHPNAAGYDLLAKTFADVLSGVDLMPPVPGLVSPADQAQNVAANAGITVNLYDFGTGIDLNTVELFILDQQVTATRTGDSHKVTLSFQPPSPLDGIVSIRVQAQDLASPPNTINRVVSTFIIEGTTFLEGDLNRDGRVDGLDLVILALAFGAHRYNTNYSLIADMNGDGIVDGFDLAIIAANFGKRSF
jgi:acyl-CoA thioesterase-1